MVMNNKPWCQVCKGFYPSWAWQPWGPDADGLSFTTLGSHYRGFPIVKVCEGCREAINEGQTVEFTYMKNLYEFKDGTITSLTDLSAPKKKPVRKLDLQDQKIDSYTTIIDIAPNGLLCLTGAQIWLVNGRHMLFKGTVSLPLKDFTWIDE